MPASAETPAGFERAAESRGFCSPGTPPSTDSARTHEEPSWGSHCAGRPHTGELILTGVRTQGGSLPLRIAGQPTAPGIELALRIPGSAEQHELELQANPHNTWKLVSFRLPRHLHDVDLELVVRDTTRTGSWIAVAQASTGWTTSAAPTWTLLLGVVFHGALFLLPGVGAVALLRRRTAHRPESPIATATVATALVGYIAFWAYWLDPVVGKAFSLAIYGGSIGAVVLGLRERGFSGLSRHHAVHAICLTALVVCLYALAAFMWGGIDVPIRTIASRYSHTLPLDNMIPLMLANGVYEGAMPDPFFATWLSSDRPPLQAGLFVLQRPVIEALQFTSDKLHYQLASMWFQAAWIPALIWFLRRSGATGPLVAWVLSAIIVSGFAVVHTTYVWPKLLPAALLLFPLSALVFERSEEWKRSVEWGAFAGLAAALAMLGHGGSIFALVGMGLSALVLRRLPSFRVAGVVVAVAVLVHLPWTAYQAAADPPGNRLIKIHLAGVTPIDERGVLEAVRDEYTALGFSAAVHHKLENFAAMGSDFGGTLGYLGASLRPGDGEMRRASISKLRERMFHQVFPALGVLNLGFLSLAVLALRKTATSQRARIATRGVLVAGVTLIVWCLAMFGPGTTQINHGTYLPLLLLFIAATIGLFAGARRFAAAIASTHLGLSAYLYLFAKSERALLPASQWSSTGYAAPDATMMAAAAALAVAVVALLWRQASVGAYDPAE